jgi:large subunit ribosomal protein L20
MFRRKWILS